MTGYNIANQLLGGPAVLDKFRGKVIEQFGMRRQLPTGPEIFGRSHDSVSEQMMPDSIHIDASGKRVLCIRNPFGKLLPAALGGLDFRSGSYITALRKPRGTDSPS